MKAGYSEEVLTKVDVLKKAAEGGVYDNFRDRIMFPFLI